MKQSILRSLCFSISILTAPLANAVIGGSSFADDQRIAAASVAIFKYDVAEGAIYGNCSGVLISENLIVTSAHCIRTGPKLGDKIGANERLILKFSPRISFADMAADTDDKSQTRIVEGTAVREHPQFILNRKSGDTPNDVALIKVESIPSTAKPATLLQTSDVLKKGQRVLLSGYGRVDPDHVDTVVLNISKLVTSIIDPVYKLRGQVSMKSSRTETLENGDSGGGSFVVVGSEVFLWGTHTFSDPRLAINSENLVLQRDWIKKTAAEMGATVGF